jgi:hypothetical protein
MSYLYIIWYVENWRSKIYATTEDFAFSEMLKRECWRIHGNASTQIKEMSNVCKVSQPAQPTG